jgi:trk system potassium uptake protein TrkH
VPQALPVLGFAVVILIGSVLLWLPWAHGPGALSYLDALFTATSAVCVTGLTTVNTATDFTVAGQVIILVLIQIGGLGVMTYAAMAVALLGRRLSLRAQAALHDSLFQSDQAREFKRLFRQIISITLTVEALGVLLMFFTLLPGRSAGTAAWSALFHSISSFCNAGFSLFPNNLVDVRSNHLFMSLAMILIVLGGLGFLVLRELFDDAKRVLTRGHRTGVRRYSLHTDVVLRTSLGLIVAGTAMLLLFGLTSGEHSWGQRVEAALFQSISARTCGYNSVDIRALPIASLLVLVALMFVGGSPASCASGVKTSTIAVLFARIRGYVTGEDEARLLGRKIGRPIIRSAGLLLAMAVGWNLLGVLILSHFEAGRPGIELQNLLFEQVSAFGTVGLTATTTTGLSVVGKLWIIATMYVGRLGPLTLASLAVHHRTSRFSLPEGKVMIG